MNDPILITGIPRSGISIIAGVINHCGAYGGVKAEEDYDGRCPMEHEKIKSLIMKPLMNGLCQNSMPSTKDCHRVASPLSEALRRRVQRFIDHPDGAWFYASSQLCLTWPIWHEAFPNAKWIIVRRDDKDIIDACMKTTYMKAYSDASGWQSWIDKYRAKFDEMLNIQYLSNVWPNKSIDGNIDDLQRLIKNFELKWDAERVADFLSPILWKKGVFDVIKK